MQTLIHQRVELAKLGKNPYVIGKLKSGWAVVGDVQPLEGYCLLLSDPVISDLNSLNEAERIDYCLDMIRIGDALLKVTNSYRINYETWGNTEPALHTHIMPRYSNELDEKRGRPAMLNYSWKEARRFNPTHEASFIKKMQECLVPYLVSVECLST